MSGIWILMLTMTQAAQHSIWQLDGPSKWESYFWSSPVPIWMPRCASIPLLVKRCRLRSRHLPSKYAKPWSDHERNSASSHGYWMECQPNHRFWVDLLSSGVKRHISIKLPAITKMPGFHHTSVAYHCPSLGQKRLLPDHPESSYRYQVWRGRAPEGFCQCSVQMLSYCMVGCKQIEIHLI